ncbi:hypothetical protein CsSME_00018892 [Camellia sinensis var. sinensis]
MVYAVVVAIIHPPPSAPYPPPSMYPSQADVYASPPPLATYSPLVAREPTMSLI